jgi:predicted DNA-binding ribbon-helix-helix protein
MGSIQGKGAVMKSLVVKRSIVIAGHKTSVSLEDAFWRAIKEIAVVRGTTLSNLVSSIDAERKRGNLSSGIRLFVLDFYRSRLNKERAAQNAPPVLLAVPRTGSV